jgi:NAD(P)-dependent dehydrogenase (short-subunit alcohol dehydrogenase family)
VKLDGAVALITGASSSIGSATATLFAQEGAKLVLVDDDPAKLAQLRGRLEATGAVVRSFRADAVDGDEAVAIANGVTKDWGRIDTLVTCAEIWERGNAVTISEESFDRALEVNVKGSFLWVRAVLPHMVERKKGSIVFISSQQAFNSGGNDIAYTASKGAIVSLTKALAVDHARQGVRVNALVPASADMSAEKRATSIARHAMDRPGSPDEVARGALFLASDDSSFTTGSLLYVDGGWTAK